MKKTVGTLDNILSGVKLDNEHCPECRESDSVFVILAVREGACIVLAARYCANCAYTWEKEEINDTNDTNE